MTEKISNNSPPLTGTIFDIERYATKDGPGIRTVVFFKGCGLRCLWCANPESQEFPPQINFYSKKCRGCGRCTSACRKGAIIRNPEFGTITDTRLCIRCGSCISQCYYDAREMVGRNVTVEEVMSTILRDEMYYNLSQGGVTLSGGEPMLQAEFAAGLLKACKEYGLNTALETCGFAPKASYEKVMPLLDLIYFDIKTINEEKHKQFTEQSNKNILANFEFINKVFGRTIIVRIPYIPDFNDSETEIRKAFQYLSEFKSIHSVEIMPFHCLGSGKYESLGRHYAYAGTKSLDKSTLSSLVELGKEYGLNVILNG